MGSGSAAVGCRNLYLIQKTKPHTQILTQTEKDSLCGTAALFPALLVGGDNVPDATEKACINPDLAPSLDKCAQ